jgi:hypothetical protein
VSIKIQVIKAGEIIVGAVVTLNSSIRKITDLQGCIEIDNNLNKACISVKGENFLWNTPEYDLTNAIICLD